jgi:hypothetical protein
MRTVFLVFICWLLSACGEEKRVVHQIGAITHTEYWVTEPLRWEGASRHYEYEELCSPKLIKCLNGKHLSMSEFRSPTSGMLAVTFDESIDGQSSGKKPYSRLLNTVTGEEIKCENCDMENLDFGRGAWLKNGTVLSPLIYRPNISPAPFKPGEPEQEQYSRYFVFFESLHGNPIVAQQKKLILVYQKNSKSYESSYSPSLNTEATFKCNPECIIYWLNEDLTGYKSKPTGCASEKLFIVWNGDEPEAVFSNWAQTKDICLDKNGKPMFRQITYEEYLALPKPGFGGNDTDRHPVWETKNSP